MHEKTETFGMQVRRCRDHIGMGAEELGMLYARALGRASYSRRRIEQMEQNDAFPNDPTRRWIIAQLVRMSAIFPAASVLQLPLPSPAAVPSLSKPSSFDLQELHVRLQHYWSEGYPGSLEEAKKALHTILKQIVRATPTMSGKQRTQAYRLLCGYHILLAVDLCRGQGNTRGFLHHIDQVLAIASANNYEDLVAVAYQQRQTFFLDQGNYEQALAEHAAAMQLKAVPGQLQGKMLAEAARARAALAHTQQERTAALFWADQSEQSIETSSLLDFPYFVAFDREKYLLNRAMTLMGSPLKRIRTPEEATQCLAETKRSTEKLFSAHRQAHHDIIQAAIALDQEWYPVAVTLLDEAINQLERIHSRVHFYELSRLYQQLKASPYGEQAEVTVLHIGMLRLQYPELFIS
jgi:tetratricopeptide (TPR) repeat protein